jgi:hypothetical protein
MRVNPIKTNKLLSLSSKLIPVLILSLAILSFVSGRVSAAGVATPLVFDSAASAYFASLLSGTSGVDGANTVPYDPSGLKVAAVWKLDSACVADITQVTASTVYSATYNTTDAQGSFLFVGDANTQTSLGTLSNITDGYDSSPWLFTDIGGSNAKDGTAGATWSNDTHPADIYVALIVFGNNSYPDGITTVNKPTVDVQYSASSQCANQPPTISPTAKPASTTIPTTTASGSQIIPGSSLSITDPDGDPLTYSITDGNSSNYFSIDPTTGNISTNQSNIPAGTYTLTIQVDDGKGGVITTTVTIVVSDTSTTVATTSDANSNVVITKKELANTGINMTLILNLSLMAVITSIIVRRFSIE